jgi:hypothetical protein
LIAALCLFPAVCATLSHPDDNRLMVTARSNADCASVALHPFILFYSSAFLSEMDGDE